MKSPWSVEPGEQGVEARLCCGGVRRGGLPPLLIAGVWLILLTGICSAAPPHRGDVDTPGASIVVAGRAVLPARTFREGPTSGHAVSAVNGVRTPFLDEQPVGGFSDLASIGKGEYWALSDNGFGTQANSFDYVLALYRVAVDFSRQTMSLRQVIELSDPQGRAGFLLVAQREHYPETTIPVDERIRAERLLTGADFDPESLAVMPDGSFWVGEEFGPFLLHFDAKGRLLAAPVPVPGVLAPENPQLAGRKPNHPSSGGFEGMDATRDGNLIYALLEKTAPGDPPGCLRLYRFEPATANFTDGAPYAFYPLDAPKGHYVGALAVLGPGLLAVLERDDQQGAAARCKKIFLVDVEPGADGKLPKRELADLLLLPDPEGLARGAEGNRTSKTFAMPYITPEGITKVDDQHLAICNDNNFPFSVGRHEAEGKPDDSEIVLLRLRDGIPRKF